MNKGRCSVCGRVSDRWCPGLDKDLCSRCCGLERGRTIVCRKDCRHLQAAEARLQTRRARELEQAWGAWLPELARTEGEDVLPYVEFLGRVLATLLRKELASDGEVEAALRHLDQQLSPVVLVSPAPPPLGRALGELLVPLHHKRSLDGEKLRKVARAMADWVRSFRSDQDNTRFVRGLLGLFPPEHEPPSPGLIVRPGQAP